MALDNIKQIADDIKVASNLELAVILKAAMIRLGSSDITKHIVEEVLASPAPGAEQDYDDGVGALHDMPTNIL